MEIVHSWLKDYLGESVPATNKIDDLLTYHAYEVEGIEEREGEVVFDLDVLPNRSSDSLCHRGVARELATLLDIKLENDPLREKPVLAKTDKVLVNISDPIACPRFTLSLISGVAIKESPLWLQKRLKVIGQRPINNIVDATNYVMYALGQPMHAYDADKFPQLDGKWQFAIRFAKEGEEVSLLSEGGKDEDRVVQLLGTELLIVDGSTDTPVGLAGIKGGRFAEMDENTNNVLVEAASFQPATIRKTARRLGILTDASKRFENNPSRELPLYAQREVIDLIKAIAGGECEGVVDEYPDKYQPVTTKVRVSRVNALLGLTLDIQEVKKNIERTGARVIEESDSELSVTAPWERTDLNVEVDYTEEVGRIHGLSDIESIFPEPRPLTEINKRQYYSEKLRTALVSVGFSEVITSSFLKKGKIQLQNALASDKSYVRNTLTKNISDALDNNISYTDLLGIRDVRIFEIGTVFDKTEAGVGEYLVITLGARTKGNGYCQKDDTVLEEGLTVVAEVLGNNLKWQIERGVAELNFTNVLSDLEMPTAYDALPKKEAITFKKFSQYPAITRDIALWVAKDDQAESVIGEIIALSGPLLVHHSLFDTFTKDGRTSYAFRLVFQADDRTLTDAEISTIMEAVYESVAQKGWEVR